MNEVTLDHLPTRYAYFFDLCQKNKRAGDYDEVYFGALDAEWVFRAPRNHLLCYQVAACSRQQYANNLYMVKDGERPEMQDIITKLISSVNGGEIPESHHRKRILVCLACHNTTAEFSILKDRDEPHIFEAISLVHKSPVTLLKPIELTLPSYCQVDVRLFDTMLLAPATHRSLKKLSSLLGAKDEMKENILQYHIEHMDVYLREKPEEFRKYALKDTEVTLKLFFLLQESLNKIAFKGKVKQLFITLGNAAMNSFISENSWNKKYLKKLNAPDNYDAVRLVRRAYFGGRNEGFLRGITSEYPATQDKTWVDFDLCGCYPSAASLIPRIDPEQKYRLLKTLYQLDKERVDALVQDNVPQNLIDDACSALLISSWQFENTLRNMKKPVVSSRIRAAARVYDNTLINEWYAEWQKTKENRDSELEHCVYPDFAMVRFHFKEKPPLYPCLHVHHCKYGLVYTLKDETVTTHLEIMLAMDAGAHVDAIWSLELPIERDKKTGKPVYYMQEFMAGLAKKRKDYKDEWDKSKDPTSSVNEKLLKEFMNSLYGKFAQRVNSRRVANIATFEMVQLEKSKITDPIVAALTTGTARAALSSILLAAEQFNQGKAYSQRIDVASCTTDGLLLGLPSKPGYSVVGDYYQLREVSRDGGKKYIVPEMRSKEEVNWGAEAVLDDFGCKPFWESLDTYLPIRLFRNARIALTQKDEYLEIKGMADVVAAIKSRGQIGFIPLSGDLNKAAVTILAKFSVKPPLQELETDKEEYKYIYESEGVRKQVEGGYLLDHFTETEDGRDAIITIHQYNLPSASKIMKSNGQLDLTQDIANRKLNCDFDFKRLPLLTESPIYNGGELYPPPYTLPHLTLGGMKIHRHQMENIRRGGRVARPEEVIARVTNTLGKKTRAQGGSAAEMFRVFVRGLLQGYFNTSTGDTYAEVARKLTIVWQAVDPSYHGIRNVQKKSHKNGPQELRESWTKTDIKNCARGEWEANGLYRSPVLDALLQQLSQAFGVEPQRAADLLFEKGTLNKALVVQVTKALLCGKHLAPFNKLLLPGREVLLRYFYPALTPEMLETCEQGIFIPGERPASDRHELIRMFSRLGISHTDAAACAAVIIAPSDGSKYSDKYSVTPGCLKNAVCYFLEPDCVGGRVSRHRLKSALQMFGLTDEVFNNFKQERFMPRSLTNTAKNRADIRKIASQLRRDAAPMLAALMDA